MLSIDVARPDLGLARCERSAGRHSLSQPRCLWIYRRHRRTPPTAAKRPRTNGRRNPGQFTVATASRISGRMPGEDRAAEQRESADHISQHDHDHCGQQGHRHGRHQQQREQRCPGRLQSRFFAPRSRVRWARAGCHITDAAALVEGQLRCLVRLPGRGVAGAAGAQSGRVSPSPWRSSGRAGQPAPRSARRGDHSRAAVCPRVLAD